MEGPWIISAPLPAVESLALGAAMRCFAQFFGAIQSATAAHLLKVEGDLARFSYRILDNEIWPRRGDAELTLGIVAGLVRRCAPEADRAVTVQFEAESGRSQAAIEAHLGRHGRCGDNNVLAVPLRLLDRPAPPPAAAGDGAFRSSVRALEQHLRRVRINQPVSDRVLELLLARMGQEATDQDAIARELGMSRCTLHRRLDAEGACFTLLCQIARRNIGHALLVRTEMPMIEIAMRLGYSDHTAFSRWFGASPRALRKAGAGSSATT